MHSPGSDANGGEGLSYGIRDTGKNLSSNESLKS